MCPMYGELLQIEEFPDDLFVVHYDTESDEWVVSELSLGMSICKSMTKNRSETIGEAKTKLLTHKERWSGVKDNSIRRLKEIGIAYPINELNAEADEK